MYCLSDRVFIDIEDFDLKHNTSLIIYSLVDELRSKPSFKSISFEGDFDTVTVDYNDIVALCVQSSLVKLVYGYEDFEVSLLLDDNGISCIKIMR